MLPSENRLRQETTRAGLEWSGIVRFGQNYADTLAEWARRFEAAWDDIKGLGFDERFRRLWRFYLSYCAGGFRAERTNVVPAEPGEELGAETRALILQTDRLTLSELGPPTLHSMLELLTSCGFVEGIGDRGIRDLEGAAAYIGRVRAGYAANGFGLWRCDAKADGAPVGTYGLIKRDGLRISRRRLCLSGTVLGPGSRQRGRGGLPKLRPRGPGSDDDRRHHFA